MPLFFVLLGRNDYNTIISIHLSLYFCKLQYTQKRRKGTSIMLNIFYGKMPEAIFNTTVYFKNVYKYHWITDPFSRKMIADVDQSTVIDEAVIDSPVLGKISPLSLSGGVKTLILIKNEPQTIFNASTCGDNCTKWILKIGEIQDTTVNLRHLMEGTYERKSSNYYPEQTHLL